MSLVNKKRTQRDSVRNHSYTGTASTTTTEEDSQSDMTNNEVVIGTTIAISTVILVVVTAIVMIGLLYRRHRILQKMDVSRDRQLSGSFEMDVDLKSKLGGRKRTKTPNSASIASVQKSRSQTSKGATSSSSLSGSVTQSPTVLMIRQALLNGMGLGRPGVKQSPLSVQPATTQMQTIAPQVDTEKV